MKKLPLVLAFAAGLVLGLVLDGAYQMEAVGDFLYRMNELTGEITICHVSDRAC